MTDTEIFKLGKDAIVKAEVMDMRYAEYKRQRRTFLVGWLVSRAAFKMWLDSATAFAEAQSAYHTALRERIVSAHD